jgi:hypothetical protein
LIENKNSQRDDGNAAIRTLKNGSGGRHSTLKSKVQSPKSSQPQAVS